MEDSWANLLATDKKLWEKEPEEKYLSIELLDKEHAMFEEVEV